jgi:hypothetical protein
MLTFKSNLFERLDNYSLLSNSRKANAKLSKIFMESMLKHNPSFVTLDEALNLLEDM